MEVSDEMLAEAFVLTKHTSLKPQLRSSLCWRSVLDPSLDIESQIRGTGNHFAASLDVASKPQLVLVSEMLYMFAFSLQREFEMLKRVLYQLSITRSVT